MDYDQWLNLMPHREAIERELIKAKFPLTGWVNEFPAFSDGYEVDWDMVDKIANVAVKTDALSQRPNPPPPKKVPKPRKGAGK